MNVAGITGFSAQSQRLAFGGYWKHDVKPAPYPHEDTFVGVNIYVADEDEPISEIEKNFAARANSTDFLRPHTIYTPGENYFAEIGQNPEARKMQLTLSATRKVEQHNYVDAVKDKIKIAKILKKQDKERDKFLTEEGIRQIYALADEASKDEIHDVVWNYNPDMAKSLRINSEIY